MYSHIDVIQVHFWNSQRTIFPRKSINWHHNLWFIRKIGGPKLWKITSKDFNAPKNFFQFFWLTENPNHKNFWNFFTRGNPSHKKFEKFFFWRVKTLTIKIFKIYLWKPWKISSYLGWRFIVTSLSDVKWVCRKSKLTSWT